MRMNLRAGMAPREARIDATRRVSDDFGIRPQTVHQNLERTRRLMAALDRGDLTGLDAIVRRAGGNAANSEQPPAQAAIPLSAVSIRVELPDGTVFQGVANRTSQASARS